MYIVLFSYSCIFSYFLHGVLFVYVFFWNVCSFSFPVGKLVFPVLGSSRVRQVLLRSCTSLSLLYALVATCGVMAHGAPWSRASDRGPPGGALQFANFLVRFWRFLFLFFAFWWVFYCFLELGVLSWGTGVTKWGIKLDPFTTSVGGPLGIPFFAFLSALLF